MLEKIKVCAVSSPACKDEAIRKAKRDFPYAEVEWEDIEARRPEWMRSATFASFLKRMKVPKENFLITRKAGERRIFIYKNFVAIEKVLNNG